MSDFDRAMMWLLNYGWIVMIAVVAILAAAPLSIFFDHMKKGNK